MKTFEPKDPDAIMDFVIDWTRWLSGDTIASSTWVVPAGITRAAVAATTTSTTIWLSGGTHASKYTITNRIVTVAGRTDDRSFIVPVRHT